MCGFTNKDNDDKQLFYTHKYLRAFNLHSKLLNPIWEFPYWIREPVNTQFIFFFLQRFRYILKHKHLILEKSIVVLLCIRLEFQTNISLKYLVFIKLIYIFQIVQMIKYFL